MKKAMLTILSAVTLVFGAGYASAAQAENSGNGSYSDRGYYSMGYGPCGGYGMRYDGRGMGYGYGPCWSDENGSYRNGAYGRTDDRGARSERSDESRRETGE